MKNLILFALTIGLLVSCRKTQEPPLVKTAKMTADVGNRHFSVVETDVKAQIKNGWLIISGAPFGYDMELHVPNIDIGTYQVGRNNFAYAYYRFADVEVHSNVFDDDTGEIVITEINLVDSTVSDHFSFKGSGFYSHNTLDIRNGVFEYVPLTNLDAVPNKPELLTLEKEGRIIALPGIFRKNDSSFVAGTADPLNKRKFDFWVTVPLYPSPLGTVQVVGHPFNYTDGPSVYYENYPEEEVGYTIALPGSTITVTEFDSVANSIRFSFDVTLYRGEPLNNRHFKGHFEGDFK